MATQSFTNKTSSDLAFTNISVTETDTGTVSPFINPTTPANSQTQAIGQYQALDFAGFSAQSIFAGSSMSLEFKYDVTATTPGLGISALQQAFTPDSFVGPVHLIVMEKVYNSANVLVGSTYVDLSNVVDPVGATYAMGDIVLNGSYSMLHVDVTLVASVDASATGAARVSFSNIEQGFATSGVTAAPQPGALSGHVFLDANDNGLQDTGDSNLAGITVQLLDSNGNVIVGSTAVTDANGAYSFTGLAAGSYSVAFTSPAGDKFDTVMGTDANGAIDSIVNTAGQTSLVAVTAGNTTVNQNAGVFAPATLTTHVYIDTNKDNVQDNGETNAAGVTVNLLTGAGAATGITAVTDANGNASFTGLLPGSYEVSVNTPAGDTVTQATNVATPITLVGGQTANAVEGLFIPASLSGHIFVDTNDNGLQDSGDTNLAGVTVALLNSAGVATGATAVTDANGAYSFTNLIPGSYAVKFTAPGAYKFDTVTGTSTNGAIDSIVGTNGQTSPVTVVGGANTPNQNAGVFLPGTFTTHVYLDSNKDSLQDNAEVNASGVAVSLFSNGVATGATAVTDANGNVSFTGLIPGSYSVAVGTPTGDTVTQALNVGTPVTVASGQTVTATEGLFVPGALSGHIFLDANDNGLQDSGDINLAGVTVSLLNSAGVATGATAITDANGAYSFTNLIPGSYAVKFTSPAGDKFDTVMGANANGAIDSIVNTAGQTSLVAVTAGNTTANQNAGVFAPATLTTHVYIDTNKDNVQDNGETNAAGVTVNLLTGAGAATGITAVTDANGNASFTGLLPGSYEVSVNTPAGDTVTQATNVATPITLVGGQTANAVEGLFIPASLSGHIFVDTNDNGLQDSGDTNLAGVTVALLNSAGVATGATAVTDANGAYSFTNLIPGSYAVKFTAPGAYKFDTVTGTSTNGAIDSIVGTNGQTSPVTVVGGANTPNQNAGVFLPGSIITHVYSDTNKDGSQDNGEQAKAGVTVNLLTGAGVATGVTAVTDASGNVSFTGLAPGSYEVSVNAPAGTSSLEHLNVGTPLTLAAGQTIKAIDGLISSAPSITIQKIASVSATTPGNNVCPPLTYTFVVTNTGPTALTGVKVVDVTNGDPTTAVTYTDPNTLAAGATWTYTTPAVTVAATKGTVATIGSGHGFDLGDSATYGVIAFNPKTFTENSSTPLVGNVGVAAYTSVSVGGSGIAGNFVSTGATPAYSSCTSFNFSTWSWQTTTTGVKATGNVLNDGKTTSYGTAGWGENWASESGTGNNCYSSFGCNGSTGSAVWDNFWNQNCSSSSSNLVLKVSEDAWKGDAQFTVMVDGCQVGGTYTATSSHGCGSQSINLGAYAQGAHSVVVNFLNDAYGGTCSTDRNLYVDSISFGGNSYAGATFMSGGAQTLAVNPATTKALVLDVSEDAWKGDAQFTVSVDGCQVGGTYSATTSHGCGTQGINLGSYADGSHKVVVTFINDACGGTCSTDRNLYVDGLTFGGNTTSGATLCSNGSSSFTVGSTTSSNCGYSSSVCGADSDDTWGSFFQNCSSNACYNTNYAGAAYNTVANSASLAADIASLKALSTTLFAEAGKSVALGNGTTLAATSGTLDAGGNEVFSVTAWSTNFCITGDGSHAVVLNVAANQSLNLGNVSLSGGISANQVMINYTGTNAVTDANNTTTNATVLAANAKVTLDSGSINGHVYGGAAGQDFSIASCASVDAPALQAYSLTDVATASGTASGTTVSAFDTAAVTVNPLGAGVSQSCNAPSSCDNLWSDYGQLQKLELCFNPGTTVHTNAGGCGVSAGNCNTGSSTPCFITVTDKASDSLSGCTTYYQGSVAAGEKFYADASQLWNGSACSGTFSTAAGANLFVHVFNSQADCLAGNAAVQECAYDTSGSHAISLGDQIGCVSVAGYVSTSGHGYVS